MLAVPDKVVVDLVAVEVCSREANTLGGRGAPRGGSRGGPRGGARGGRGGAPRGRGGFSAKPAGQKIKFD
jgi:hypothetical protein